jgi:hypothetical protein
VTAAEARELMAPWAASIQAEADRAPALPQEAIDILRATGLGRYVRPASDVQAAS